MLILRETDSSETDDWAERSEYCSSIADSATRKSKRSEDNNSPLILNEQAIPGDEHGRIIGGVRGLAAQ